MVRYPPVQSNSQISQPAAKDGLRRQHLPARRPHRRARGGGRAERSANVGRASVGRPEDVCVRQRQSEAERGRL